MHSPQVGKRLFLSIYYGLEFSKKINASTRFGTEIKKYFGGCKFRKT